MTYMHIIPHILTMLLQSVKKHNIYCCPWNQITQNIKLYKQKLDTITIPGHTSAPPSPFSHAHTHNLASSSSSYYNCSVCLSVCLFVPYLLRGPLTDLRQTWWVGVCRWTSELPLRGSFSKRSMGRRVNGSRSLSTILYMRQPHSTQLQKAALPLLHLIRLKGTFCCTDGWWVYVGGSRNCLLDG